MEPIGHFLQCEGVGGTIMILSLYGHWSMTSEVYRWSLWLCTRSHI